MIRRATAVLGASSALALTGCGVFVVSEVPPDEVLQAPPPASSAAEPVPPPTPPSSTPPPSSAAAATSVLEPTLDAAGRPYDVALPEGVTVSWRPLTTLATDGEQLVVDGGEYLLGPSMEPLHVPLPASDAVEVGLVLADRPGATQPSVAGVVLGEPAAVDRWAPFQPAYGTDGGMGAIWTQSAAYALDPREWPDARHPVAQAALDRLIAGESWVLTDADGDGEDDGLLFGNGWGDGGFPMSSGVDARGRVVAVAIWHLWVPWRLGLPDGVPPSDVRRAEDAIARCLAAGTDPLQDGTCRD